jgi:hypothetical protein
MGKIETDHTGSGGGITLSSDGTSLLLNGTAIGGGGAALELYAENPSSPTAPSATGTNAVAIGSGVSATNTGAISLGFFTVASGVQSLALGASADATSQYATAVGKTAQAVSTNANAFGKDSYSNGNQATAIGDAYASGTDSFAAAIAVNNSSYGATGANSIAIGRLSKASGADSFAIGDNNIVANGDAFALGNTNNVTGGSTAFAIGTNHTVSGTLAACIGGSTSTATQTYAMTFGPYAKAAVQNAFIFGSKGWFSAGSAQGGMYILYADTTDATAEALTTTNSTAGSTNQIVAANDTGITFDGTITAMQNGAQAYASWKIEGLLVNDGGTTTLANSATTVISNGSSWGMALSADNTNNALAITCTGEASHNIRWVANIRTTEVTYA